jgi:cytidylate kinase
LQRYLIPSTDFFYELFFQRLCQPRGGCFGMKIALSSLSGAGITTACNNVAKALTLKVINYTMRNIAQEAGVDFFKLLEKAKKDQRFDYCLDKRIMDEAEMERDCVVGTRLACWLVNADLTVWLHAPLRVRAKRIAKREGKPLAQVIEETRKRDLQDAMRYKRIYGVNINNHSKLDLVINTEHLTADQVSALIIAAARLAGENRIRAPAKSAEKIKGMISKNFGNFDPKKALKGS